MLMGRLQDKMGLVTDFALSEIKERDARQIETTEL